ncbi:hypothetical protein H4R19_002616, partial [Coemansia spiralis]
TPRAGVVAGAAFTASAFFAAVYSINPITALPPMACRVLEFANVKAGCLYSSSPPSVPSVSNQTITAADIARAGLFNTDDSAAHTQEAPALGLPNLTTCIGLGLMICAIFLVWLDGHHAAGQLRSKVDQCNAAIHNLDSRVMLMQGEADALYKSVKTLSAVVDTLKQQSSIHHELVMAYEKDVKATVDDMKAIHAKLDSIGTSSTKSKRRSK